MNGAATEPHKASTRFEERLVKGWPRLKAILSDLYGDHPRFSDFESRLLTVMRDAAAARAGRLVALDDRRTAEPDWLLASDTIGYSAYVERFGANLAGVQAKIPYLQSLGVRYLHLLPFWKARAGDNDGGFAVSDFREVREDLGDRADLEALCRALSEAGIALCADFVLNHTADDHAWARAALAGEAWAKDLYHLVPDRAAVEAWEASLGQVFPSTAPGNFTWRDELGAYVWTTFYPFQWDLNWSNPQVFCEMAATLLDLANLGIEGFRLDSAAYLWKRQGSACKALPECHQILRALRQVAEITAPAIRLKSEVIGPVAESAPFLGSKSEPECHLGYHAGLMTAGWASLAEKDADLVRRVLADAPDTPTGAGWVTYVRCHDDIGWMTLAPQIAAADLDSKKDRLRAVARVFDSGEGYARGEAFQAADSQSVHGLNGMAASLTGFETGDPLALARLGLLYGLSFAAGGMPLIYMGDELGQLNDPSFSDDPERRHEGRWLHRPMFDAAEAQHPGPRAAAVQNLFRTLTAARRNLPPLCPETTPRPVENTPGALLAVKRGQDTLLLFNFSEDPLPVADLIEKLDFSRGQDILTGRAARDAACLPAHGQAWIRV